MLIITQKVTPELFLLASYCAKENKLMSHRAFDNKKTLLTVARRYIVEDLMNELDGMVESVEDAQRYVNDTLELGFNLDNSINDIEACITAKINEYSELDHLSVIYNKLNDGNYKLFLTEEVVVEYAV
jgi:hypothetical protein